MGSTIANFAAGLILLAIVATVLKPGSQIGTALNGTSNLVSSSIKAAKS